MLFFVFLSWSLFPTCTYLQRSVKILQICKNLQRSVKILQICKLLQRSAEILQIFTDSQRLKTWVHNHLAWNLHKFRLLLQRHTSRIKHKTQNPTKSIISDFFTSSSESLQIYVSQSQAITTEPSLFSTTNLFNHPTPFWTVYYFFFSAASNKYTTIYISTTQKKFLPLSPTF